MDKDAKLKTILPRKRIFFTYFSKGCNLHEKTTSVHPKNDAVIS